MKMEERLRNERRLGHEEGRAEGREEGLAEGEKKGERKLICKLLLNGTVDMATAVRTSGLSEEEMRQEELYWQEYVRTRIPKAYDGIREILERFRREGGLICVDSHSYSHYIRRDYAHNHLPEPDLIFGWDLAPDKRKPSPYTVFEIRKRFDLKREEILIVDDLKPGYDMARAAGVAIAGAGWANDVPQIEAFMKENCDFYFKEVAQLQAFLFGP